MHKKYKKPTVFASAGAQRCGGRWRYTSVHPQPMSPVMPHVTYREPNGRAITLEVPVGTSLMRGAMDAGVDGIEAQCGGNCACATCHCYVDEPWLAQLPPPSADERLMLGNVAAEQRPNSRLSCQLVMQPALDGIGVQFPERQS